MSTANKTDLRLAAYAADDEFSFELKRVYGKRAGDMRYASSHADERVTAARDAKHAADAAWHAA